MSRRWRALAGIGAAVGLSFALGFLVFGSDNHREWLQKLVTADRWAWLPMNGSLMGMLSRTLTSNPSYASVTEVSAATLTALWLGLGIAIGFLTHGVALLDGTPCGIDRAFAMLLVGALLLSPLGWVYYYWLPLGPVVALTATWWPAYASAAGPAAASPWVRRFLLAGLPLLAYPINGTKLCGPHPLSTLLVGSIFFWAALLIWVALVLDGLRGATR